VEQSLQSTLHRPVLSRRLDGVDESFKSVTEEFCSGVAVPDNCSYLLIIILKEVYELLRQHVETHCSPVSNVIQFSAPEGIVILTRIPHGQIQISIEKLVEVLTLSERESEQIDEYIYRVHRQIGTVTEHTSPLTRIVMAAELWTDHLVALARHTFPRHSNGLKDAVKTSLEEIKFLLAARNTRYIIQDTIELNSRGDSPTSNDGTCRSEMFLWHELGSGGDGSGKVYKVRSK
jgi:hypothetical protein